MVRYYACIVGKYGQPVQRALQKLAALPLDVVCSTHGPVWTTNIAKVVGIYDRLSRYEAENGVVIVYGSMYGNTEQMAEIVAERLAARGVKPIVMHNASKSHVSDILADVFRYRGIIAGSPTYNTEIYPEVESALHKIAAREVKNRIFGFFGACSWAGAALRKMRAYAETNNWQVVDAPAPVEMKHAPTEDIRIKCEQLADAMADALQQK
jgi:flavorubredoxin